MAYVEIPNTDWEYDNTATAADTYSDTPGTIAAGIRTYTTRGGATRQTYIKCRKVTNNGYVAVGEIDKTFNDLPFSVYKEVVNPISTDGVEGAEATGSQGTITHDGTSFGLKCFFTSSSSGITNYLRSNYLLTVQKRTYDDEALWFAIGRGNNAPFTTDTVQDFTGVITVKDLSGNVQYKFSYTEHVGITTTLVDGNGGDAIPLSPRNSDGYKVIEGDVTNLVNGQYYNVYRTYR